MKNRIFLVGFMGSGKSFVGEALAKHLDLPFFDSDKVIEEQEGKCIHELFFKGEEQFRVLEKKVVADLVSQNSKMVLSLGGGAVLDEGTRELLKQSGEVVWMNTDFDTCFHRIKNDRNRPLAFEENSEKIKQLFDFRKTIYRKAYTFICNESDLQVCIDKITEFLKKG